MADIVINPSPKARYMGNAAAVKVHRELMQKPELQAAIDYALLHYQGILAAQSDDMAKAATNGFKIAGALEFVGVMKNLAEPFTVAAPKKDTGNLQHQA